MKNLLQRRQHTFALATKPLGLSFVREEPHCSDDAAIECILALNVHEQNVFAVQQSKDVVVS